MLNRSSSSLVTCRSISPFGPVVWFCVAAPDPGGTVGGNTCAARSDGDSPPMVDHAVEHPVPPIRGALGVNRRIQCRRPLDERRQQRALGDRQLLDGLVEVGLRRRRDAVGAAAEVDDVQVGLQHLVLGPLARHLRGDDEFLGFAHQAADAGSCVADERVLDVLLGDRRSTLQVTAEDVVLERAREPGEREAGVGVEVAVLGRHHRVAHMHRYLVDVDVDPITFRRNDLRQLRAVAGENRRHLVGADVAGLGHVDDEVGHART